MPAIGSATKVINATEVRLFLGDTGSEYVLLQEIELVLDRPETREAVALGSVYFFGQHNHVFDATILLSATEIDTFVTMNTIGTGALTPGNYIIQYQPKSGSAVKITATSETPRMSFEKLPEGGVKWRGRFRITEEITSADVT